MGKLVDITGQKFGKLKVEKFAYIKSRSAYWLCECECGNKKIIKGTNLRTGETLSCGCLQKEIAKKSCKILSQKNIKTKEKRLSYREKLKQETESRVGQKYGDLEIIAFEKRKQGILYYRCKCVCGKEIIARFSELKSGHTSSCGCKRNENFTRYSHGKSFTNIYRRWIGIKGRCFNPKNSRYKDYGGRGITVCDEWLDKKQGFVNFYKWAMANGFSEELTIDRINVDGNYEPNNCRWITKKEQNWNTTRNLKYKEQKCTISTQ